MTFLPSTKSLAIGRECADENCALRVANKRRVNGKRVIF